MNPEVMSPHICMMLYLKLNGRTTEFQVIHNVTMTQGRHLHVHAGSDIAAQCHPHLLLLLFS